MKSPSKKEERKPVTPAPAAVPIVKGRTVEEAEADLEKYRAAARDLDQVLKIKEVVVAEKERTAGDEILAARLAGDPDASSRILEELRGMKTSLEISRRALTSARLAIIKGEAGVRLARAAEKREKAAELRAEIERRQLHVAALLAPLQEFEGVRFVHMPRINQATGQLEAGPSSLTQFKMVEMMDLEREAQGLEAEAERIRVRPVSPTDDEVEVLHF